MPVSTLYRYRVYPEKKHSEFITILSATKAKQRAQSDANEMGKPYLVEKVKRTKQGEASLRITAYFPTIGVKNPSISFVGGGWQAAHAYRKLPDGRVQILTNPKGKVSPKIKIVKRNRGK
jgi:hypothetical protein